jgi:hypothetical protein
MINWHGSPCRGIVTALHRLCNHYLLFVAREGSRRAVLQLDGSNNLAESLVV